MPLAWLKNSFSWFNSKAVRRGRAGSNWDEEIGCNLICTKLLCAALFHLLVCPKKYDKKIREWKKHDLRHCNLADIIQSFCWGPNSCLTPVYTSYCISNLRLSWLVFEEAVLKSHSSFHSQTANYFYSRETCDFQTESWSKSLADYFMRSLLIWDKGSGIEVEV